VDECKPLLGGGGGGMGGKGGGGEKPKPAEQLERVGRAFATLCS